MRTADNGTIKGLVRRRMAQRARREPPDGVLAGLRRAGVARAGAACSCAALSHRGDGARFGKDSLVTVDEAVIAPTSLEDLLGAT